VGYNAPPTPENTGVQMEKFDVTASPEKNALPSTWGMWIFFCNSHFYTIELN